ncbi:MAG: YfiR family protein [Bacteroidia bacterium]
MKTRLLWSALLSSALLFMSSCVSSKKYKALETAKISTDKENNDYRDHLKRSAIVSDSLKMVIVQKDSVIDSLNLKIADLQAKKEKPKASVVAKKASSLTKDQEYDKKSQFIYNFAAYIEWPVLYNGTDFVIGVEGDDDVIKKIATVIGNKKVGGKKVRVEKYDKVTKYHMVYVTSSRDALFSSIKNDVKKNKTVIIADGEAFANSGANICFTLDDDKVRYTINKPSIEKVGLKVSQELMRFSE